MKFVKKLLPLILAVSLLVVLAACASGAVLTVNSLRHRGRHRRSADGRRTLP